MKRHYFDAKKTKQDMDGQDDWQSFAMELWGLSVQTWTSIPERAGKLPQPLEYDTLSEGLNELDINIRRTMIENLSSYQVTNGCESYNYHSVQKKWLMSFG